jgi:hypothetical protein
MIVAETAFWDMSNIWFGKNKEIRQIFNDDIYFPFSLLFIFMETTQPLRGGILSWK